MRKFLSGTGIMPLAGLLLLTTLVFLLAAGCGSDDDGGGTQPVACPIEIKDPEQGDIFTTPPQNPEEDRVDIRWTAAGGGEVQVDLLKGGEQLAVLHDAVDNTGYTWWHVDELVTSSGDDYQIRLTHLTSAGCGDTGPEFTIRDLRACAIDVTIDYPNMRDMPALAGDTMTIDWVPTSTTGLYDVELWIYSAVEDELAGVIADDVIGNEVVDGWEIDSFHRGDGFYYVKVADQEIGTCVGLSDVFEMEDDVLCEIRILAPSGDGVYPKGSQLELVWVAEDTGEDDDGVPLLLDIDLYYGNLTRVEHLADEIDPDDGAFMWTVDDFNYPGEATNKYKFRISVHGDPYCYAYSDAFTIPR